MGGIPKLPKGERVKLELRALSAVEAKDLLPKFNEALRTIFQMADRVISMTNKEQAEAWIWQSIDKAERDIIATHLIELGQKSKVIAEGVRRITAAHRLLQIGLITGPRFLMTVQHYSEHGGIGLPSFGGKNKGSQVVAQSLTPVAAPAGQVAAGGGKS